ncbi:MAG: RnfABCDGE type electron transport complex subunit D [Clostridiales bacterium]|nr:RnfABCDGE type electron transport complex subunit D [Clostridiales bacterium]
MKNENRKLTVSASPHVRSNETVTGIMLDVIIALIPALVASVYVFGFRSLAVVATCVATCVLSEYICRKVMKRNNTITDLSAVVTGILLAFNLPVSIPLWMAVIGSVVAIVVVKQCFGGIGNNFVNPALVGRIVLMCSFPTAMSSWVMPYAWKSTTDMLTTATPLAEISTMFKAGDVSAQAFNANGALPSIGELMVGARQGCLGEVCAIALIIGFLYLIIRRVISPVIPLTYIGTVAVIMLIAGKGSVDFMLYEILSGGLLLGAIFMATDYTTSPINFKGKIVFAIGCGLITCLIRLFGSLPEGVSFSIVIMNILVPHIENLTFSKPFGTPKKQKEVKQ